MLFLRDYSVLGFDVSYRWKTFDFRGEYISQDVADSAQSIAPEGGTWETWYAQAAYKFGQAKWEGVVRYTDYTTPHADITQQQFAIGAQTWADNSDRCHAVQSMGSTSFKVLAHSWPCLPRAVITR